MKTPYDSAIRICRQHLDDIRLQTTRQAEMVDKLDAKRSQISEEMQLEADLVRDEVLLLCNFGAFAARKQIEATAIDVARSDARDQLDQLQARTAEAFGEFKTLDVAADRWTDGQKREFARREQAKMDDLATQSHMRTKAA